MMLSFLISPFVFDQSSAFAQSQAQLLNARAQQLIANSKRLTGVDADGCLVNQYSDDIVVCGMPDIDRKQRLPFPELTSPSSGERGPRGEIPTATATAVAQGACGMLFGDTGCFSHRLEKITGTGRGRRLLSGVSQLFGIESDNVPTSNYQDQYRDGVLSGD